MTLELVGSSRTTATGFTTTLAGTLGRELGTKPGAEGQEPA